MPGACAGQDHHQGKPRLFPQAACPTHGVREDFICSDVSQYDQMQYSLPGKVPPQYGVEPDKGCPFDCGLCTEHEQHTCVGLVEITSSCNLHCPMCYASSGPGGNHLGYDECVRSIDRLVAVEGRVRSVPAFRRASRRSTLSFCGCSNMRRHSRST